ncbi:MAG: tRNA preQ1(34) S-adenosylmethionine ribosyltransferase-isomerase QueA [Treponema sp.]|nr:tRNA preQ1(34) S-adenosylmethionine ribosyltransferase-isomerase QueA [Treponema sp.]
MRTADFDFQLPGELIAQYPPPRRGESRLMVMDRRDRSISHRMVGDLPEILAQRGKPLMVFNNTRVRKARLFGRPRGPLTGARGPVEFLLLQNLGEGRWEVFTKRARSRKEGELFLFGVEDERRGTMIRKQEGETPAILSFDPPIDDSWLDQKGHIPLPPYIKREDQGEDQDRYQTVYATETGSAASPTAGLHFTEELLNRLDGAGMGRVFVTLHVGAGTFLPVRTEKVEDHTMHREYYRISDEAAGAIEEARAQGRPILAVGTTSLRTLESAWTEGGSLARGEGSSSLFIYPGFKFQVIDTLFTNFHTPGSTLLMLVSAFGGRDFILDAYNEAIKEGYRFYSYGDACLIL